MRVYSCDLNAGTQDLGFALTSFSSMWSAPLEISIALYLLYQQVCLCVRGCVCGRWVGGVWGGGGGCVGVYVSVCVCVCVCVCLCACVYV